MSGTSRFMRSYEATGRLRTGGLSGSEEFERYGTARDKPSFNVPEIFLPTVNFVYRRFQGIRRRLESGKLKRGDYNILLPEHRDMYTYPLDGQGGLISFCGYRLHPIKHSIAMHNGVDISTNQGNWPVLATAPGRVSHAFEENDPRNITPEYGNFVIIKHRGLDYQLPLTASGDKDTFTVDYLIHEELIDQGVAEDVRKSMRDHPNLAHFVGFASVYGHLKDFSPEIKEWINKRSDSRLEDGPVVEKGQYIGLSGTTGHYDNPKRDPSSQAEHLHFEILADVLRRPEDLSMPPYHVGKSCVVNPGKLVVFR